MKKEDLKIGKKLQSRIEAVENNIHRLKNDAVTSFIEIVIPDHGRTRIQENKTVTDKANHDLVFLNQLYRDNVLRTLESCKEELEREFELLGNNDTKTELNGRND